MHQPVRAPARRGLIRTDHKWLGEQGRRKRSAVIGHGMAEERIHSGRKDGSVLRYLAEYVLGIPRRPLEPVWIVERTAKDTDRIGKPLEQEIQLGAAAGA